MSKIRRRVAVWGGALLFLVAGAIAGREAYIHLGKQPDGTYIVSSGQHILAGTIAFKGRPSDLALRPNAHVFAVLNQSSVFLATEAGVLPDTEIKLVSGAGFHGLVWSPDGSRLFASTEKGVIQTFNYANQKLTNGPTISLLPETDKRNEVPGGMCITQDGKTLYATAADLNAVYAVDLATNLPIRSYAVQNLPFDVKLSADESTLVVSNWGGRLATPKDATGVSEATPVVTNSRGSSSSGSVSFINLVNGATKSVEVGIHPNAVLVSGGTGYVANGMSDEISVLDVPTGKLTKTIPLHWHGMKVIGAMPDALAINHTTLYVADGGDNALCEIDLRTNQIKGFRPAGYFPIEVAVDDGKALVLNSKGNGSTYRTGRGGASGNAHDFEGTVSVLDLHSDLASDTSVVAKNNAWGAPNDKPQLAVYNGAIQHVLYIIKENRTYDEVFGDMPEGNGDAKLCDIGEKLAPNQHALARHFTLFDNGYVSGTNSADGHQWSTQAVCAEYLEHFYVGYSRTYPDDGRDAMTISTGGCIWDAALKKHKTVRDYGEFCNYDKAEFKPRAPKDWFEAYEDYKNGTHLFQYIAHADVASLKPLIDPNYQYWPLLQSDQARASEFIREYADFSKADKVPNLMIMSLPSDHTEGVNQTYPAPRSMIADNDLALGRIVEAVSHSPQWKNTCIFVIEDDAQSGPDHVDGHRTAYQVFSPYVRRHAVDSHLYTTVNMLKSIEVMLGLDPMNRFDMLARPIDTCFTDKPDLTPFTAVPNLVALGERSPKRTAMTPNMRHWADVSDHLNWSFLDAPDPDKLNRVIWASLHGDDTPYPYHPDPEAKRDDDGD